MGQYLYVAPTLEAVGLLRDDRLAATTERHRLAIMPPAMKYEADVGRALTAERDLDGVVLALTKGFLDRSQLAVAGQALGRKLRVWLYWPDEEALECLDRDGLKSARRHWVAINLLQRIAVPLGRWLPRWRRVRPAMRWIYRGEFPVRRFDVLETLIVLADEARPVQFATVPEESGGRMRGCGMYLRTDYWTTITSGGSYGHTCYVAKELAASTDAFVGMLTQPYALLDEWGVRYEVMETPRIVEGEDAIVGATDHYYPRLAAVCQVVRPSYIYERLCLGNYTGTLLSQKLKIPYIVEYNGSEISMSRSFDGAGYFYEDLYLKAEEAAFRQATIISVISDAVKAEVVSRGVSAEKVLVNPNGADMDAYAPASAESKASIRRELGFAAADTVVGFTGTFGGWHGVDVLADAMPRICEANPAIRFLLIGDGKHKALVDDAVASHGLESRVRCVGRVPQAEGARLLKACDLYVSPHNSHMVDSKFFGSPTKIFEYMAMAGGIVASRLEQIGDVLSPALAPAELKRGDLAIAGQRAVLCEPGSVDDFAAGVVGLAARPDIAAALGRNARRAVADHYSWSKHVDRIWRFARETASPAVPVNSAGLGRIDTGDAYKDQTQYQWNNNPVGSQHARDARPHTLEWFLEVEAHRYGAYAPWMPDTMEFSRHGGEEVLEVGGGMGTDLAQFARHGARVIDIDLSAGHLELAQENFRLRGLNGTFVHHDAETLPFADNRFDVVYSNGVLHHTPNTADVVREIFRVLRPGGLAIVMMYAENSLHYWRNLVWYIGLKQNVLTRHSMGELMSRSVERTDNDARPLVKVYTRNRLRRLFNQFTDISIVQRQMVPEELSPSLRSLLPMIERRAGWNLIIKARKPGR